MQLRYTLKNEKDELIASFMYGADVHCFINGPGNTRQKYFIYFYEKLAGEAATFRDMSPQQCWEAIRNTFEEE